jgi:hypothetical protein
MRADASDAAFGLQKESGDMKRANHVMAYAPRVQVPCKLAFRRHELRWGNWRGSRGVFEESSTFEKFALQSGTAF